VFAPSGVIAGGWVADFLGAGGAPTLRCALA